MPTVQVIDFYVPANQKTLVMPTQNDVGYHTYSTKFNIADGNPLVAAGLFL